METLQPQPKHAEALRAFQVRDAMHVGLIKCPRETPLAEVARLMAVHRVHAIVTVGAEDRALGRRLRPRPGLGARHRRGSHGRRTQPRRTSCPSRPTTRSTMPPSSSASTPSTHLIVVEPATKRPVGVISTLDVAGVFAGVRTKHDPSAMRVENVMTADVATVTPSTSLKDVATLLVERDISGVPVVDDAGELLGVVSERDLLAKQRSDVGRADGLLGWFLGEDVDAEKHWARTAGEAMTQPAITIEKWRSTAAAAGLMAEYGLKRLPVVHKGELVGIVTRSDLVRAFARSDAEIERGHQGAGDPALLLAAAGFDRRDGARRRCVAQRLGRQRRRAGRAHRRGCARARSGVGRRAGQRRALGPVPARHRSASRDDGIDGRVLQHVVDRPAHVVAQRRP